MRFSQLLKALVKGYSENAVSDSAAQLGYYLLFSVFPFLFFLVTLVAFLPIEGVMSAIMHRASAILPAQAFTLISDQLDTVVRRPHPKLLTLGLVVTLYSASRGTDAMRVALNRAYGVPERRGFLKTNAIAIGTTVLGTLLALTAFVLIILGGRGAAWLFARLGLGPQFIAAWRWIRWPLTAVPIILCASLAYNVLPDVKQRFRFLTAGSVGSTLSWLAATVGFTHYTARFGRVNLMYGSIGGVVLLMAWFYLSGVIFIMGGVLNATLEPRSLGEKPPLEQAVPRTPDPAKSRRAAGRLRGLFRRRPPTHA